MKLVTTQMNGKCGKKMVDYARMFDQNLSTKKNNKLNDDYDRAKKVAQLHNWYQEVIRWI